MKKILLIILSIFLLNISLFGSDVNTAIYKVRYLQDDGNFNTFVNAIYSGDGSFKKGGASQNLCGTLYSYDDNGINKVTGISTTISDFDSASGQYTCSYGNVEREFFKSTRAISKDYTYKRNAFIDDLKNDKIWNFKGLDNNLWRSYSKPENYNKIFSKNFGKNESLNLQDEAKKRGFFPYHDGSETVTVSQFMINLMTLNGDYFKGTDETGRLLLEPEIEKQLTTVFKKKDGTIEDVTQGFSQLTKAVEWGVSKFIPSLTGDSSDIATEAQSSSRENAFSLKSFSYTEFFDLELFGLYYNFMNMSWESIFKYAGMLLISYMTLYSTAVVGSKYSTFLLEPKETRGKFEFPMKNRFIAIAITLALTFIPYSSGDEMKAYSKDGEVVTSETTIAKEAISFFGNTGTQIADITAQGIMTAYLQYLLKASHASNHKEVLQDIKNLRENLFDFSADAVFYNSICKEGYKNSLNNFSNFVGTNNNSDMRWIEDYEWQNNGKYFDKKVSPEDRKVSLAMCRKMERSLVFQNKGINLLYKRIQKTIKTMDEEASQNHLASVSTFALIQMDAVKTLGWLDIVSLPILHIFMRNVGIIDVGEERNEIGDEDLLRTMISDTKGYRTEEQDATVEEAIDGNPISDSLKGVVKDLMGYQVYFLLPGFIELAEGMTKITGGFSQLLFNFVPAGKIVNIAKSVWEQTPNGASRAISSSFAFVTGFLIATAIYELIIKAIFGSIVALLIIVKITLYYFDVFAHFFVSPLLVAWQLTVSEKTDRLSAYIANGFVLYLIKPTLIVFSVAMFIIGYEIMESVFNLIFNLIFANLELAEKLMDNKISGFMNSTTAMLMLSNIKAFSLIMLQILGIFFAYRIIMDGDDIILRKFGYKDDSDAGIANQLNEKIQQVVGKV